MDKNNYELDEIINMEEKHKDHLKYVWIDSQKLKEANFKPEILIESLNKGTFFHEINREY